jgi:hypothetical protein
MFSSLLLGSPGNGGHPAQTSNIRHSPDGWQFGHWASHLGLAACRNATRGGRHRDEDQGRQVNRPRVLSRPAADAAMDLLDEQGKLLRQ